MQTQHECTTLLRSDTRSVAIEASPEHAFGFVADPENLPAWAVGFCRAIRRDAGSDGWIVTTASGDMPIRYATNDAAQTIDFYFVPVPGVEVAAFSRVMPNANGAEYIFTQFQTPGMSNEMFDAQRRALGEELDVLRAIVQARAACRL